MFEKWNYIITPAFVAREGEGKAQIRRYDNDLWEDVTDPKMRKSLVEDGAMVSEEKAEEVFQKLKKQATS